MDIHLDHKTELARQEQTKLTIRETSQYAEDFPQILCGDFNSGPKKAAAGFLREAGWKDAYENTFGQREAGEQTGPVEVRGALCRTSQGGRCR